MEQREQPHGTRAVIWDIDGTLIDSEPLHFAALLHACRIHDCPVTAEENDRMLGLSVLDVWRWLRAERGLAAEFEPWAGEIVRYYVEHVAPAMIRPGVRETVEGLARRGIPQGCVSTAEHRIVMANLHAIGVFRFMGCVVSREDVTHTKPDPEPYRLATRLLGVPPERCLAVEDTEVGVASAKSAGITAVAWPHAMSRSMRFDAADLVIADLRELPLEAAWLS
ncbi:MAG TPA: HAD family phosphatase [Longimicrobium sp.]|jgi:HAD superfamily hydrolase (TIGR01509 family)|uniref:HAD family hydrolase n=1 Tax=Longimicrobium sp. TaxID=2029185 RepID=UPI002ED85F14